MIIDYKLIGNRIRERRIQKGFTQESVAEYLNISVSYISRIERAGTKISLETLVKIASFLDTAPGFLIDGTVLKSGNYLHGELGEVVSSFDPDKMKLLLELAHSINNYKPSLSSD